MKIIKQILQDGADVNKPYIFLSRLKYKKYITLPILACLDFEINKYLEPLIMAGTKVNSHHIYSFYPFHEYLLDIAINNNNYYAVKTLLKYGAIPGLWELKTIAPNFVYGNICYGPINACSFPIAKLLFENFYDKYNVDFGKSLSLCDIAYANDIQFTIYLLSKGAHLKKYYYSYENDNDDKYRVNTILISAIEYIYTGLTKKQYDYIEFILQLFNYDKGYINATDSDNKTALYYTFDLLRPVYDPTRFTKEELKIKYNQLNYYTIKLIKLLVSHGADIYIGEQPQDKKIYEHFGIFTETIPRHVVDEDSYELY